jgi:hypothetical protein
MEPFRRQLERALAASRRPLEQARQAAATIAFPSEQLQRTIRKMQIPNDQLRRRLNRQSMLPDEQIRRLARQATLPTERIADQLARLTPKLPDMEQLNRVVAQAAEAAQRALKAAFPPNWHELTWEEMRSALGFGAESGINVVWAPRAQIVGELLTAADHETREQILVDREYEILEDLDRCLDLATHPSVEPEVLYAREAIASQRDGGPAAAQALSASVLSALVHDEFQFERFADAREKFTSEDPDDVDLQLARMTMLKQTFGRALHHTDHAPGPGFNRHATLHAHDGAFTRPNALAALLLLVGVVRELDVWFKRDDEQNEQREAA